MSYALGHFAFGAGMTALMIAYLLPRVELPRIVILFGGGWAMFPDVYKLVDVPAIETMHDSHVADAFWLHYTFDVYLDPDNSWAVTGLLFVFFIASMMVYEYRVALDRGPVVDIVPERLIEVTRPVSMAYWFDEPGDHREESLRTD